MSSLPTPNELDEHASRQLHEASLALQRGFAEGIGTVRDFPQTLAAFKALSEVLDQEQAVEASVNLRERIEGQQAEEALAAANVDGAAAGSKRVAVFVDGSSNSYDALRWAVGHLMGPPTDQLYLVNVMPFEDYSADAERVLQQAYDYAHHTGVKATQLHTKAVSAQGSSGTGGVGEAVARFVAEQKVDVVALGSRGLGSIKSRLLGAVGMGSVTDFCVQHLRCPVLVVKEGAVVDSNASADRA